MKKEDIVPQRRYVARAPGEGGGNAGTIIVTALEVGIPREHSKRLDGVKVRSEEPWEFRGWGLSRRKVQVEVGHEYVLSTAEVERPVDEKAEQAAAYRAETRELNARAKQLLESLGLSERSSPHRLSDEPSVEGYALTSKREVVIDTPALVRWLERIDPVKIAEDAIREVYGNAPTATQQARAHAAGYDDGFEDAVRDALEEVRQGLRVTDAELTVEPV